MVTRVSSPAGPRGLRGLARAGMRPLLQVGSIAVLGAVNVGLARLPVVRPTGTES